MKRMIIAKLEPQLNALCLLVLAFIPFNMLVTPIVDFVVIKPGDTNWTVSLSAFVFVLSAMPFLALTLLLLRTRHEVLFLRCFVALFVYGLLITLYFAVDLFYPMFGFASVLGATLVGVLFYVSVRDRIVSINVVFYSLALALFFVVMPLLLVQIDPERFALLAEGIGAQHILYGYENPRAVGWLCTISVSLLTTYLSTQGNKDPINPLFPLLIIVSSTTLFWSGSRGGVAAFSVSYFLVLALSKTRNRAGTVVSLLSIAVGGFISTFAHLPSSSFSVFSRISENLEQEGLATLSSGRSKLWQTTISYIQERPVTGYGFFPHKDLSEFIAGSAHNFVLDIWLWFGVVIGTPVLVAILVFWLKVLKFFRTTNDRNVSALFCLITTLMAYSMVSGPYARTFPLLLFAVVAGTLLGLRASITGVRIDKTQFGAI